jgi:hypothetical protein
MMSVAKENGSCRREISRGEFSVGFEFAPHRFKRVPSVAACQSGKLRIIHLYKFTLGFKFDLGAIGERDCIKVRGLS